MGVRECACVGECVWVMCAYALFITSIKQFYIYSAFNEHFKANCFRAPKGDLFFKAEMKSVYSAVRTGSLNKAVSLRI
jgi:putative heme iron utilization protein